MVFSSFLVAFFLFEIKINFQNMWIINRKNRQPLHKLMIVARHPETPNNCTDGQNVFERNNKRWQKKRVSSCLILCNIGSNKCQCWKIFSKNYHWKPGQTNKEQFCRDFQKQIKSMSYNKGDFSLLSHFSRVTIEISCQMDFSQYPFDR